MILYRRVTEIYKLSSQLLGWMSIRCLNLFIHSYSLCRVLSRVHFTFLSIFLFFSSHLLRNPFLHFPTKRCSSPQFVLPLLTHTFKVDGDDDPIDLSSRQLQLSFSAARTDSSRFKTHFRVSFVHL